MDGSPFGYGHAEEALNLRHMHKHTKINKTKRKKDWIVFLKGHTDQMKLCHLLPRYSKLPLPTLFTLLHYTHTHITCTENVNDSAHKDVGGYVIYI